MPNCDFYAANADHEAVVQFVLSKLPVTVWETYSTPNMELRRFDDVESVRREMAADPGQATFLSLCPDSMETLAKIEQIQLNPKEFGEGAFRNTIRGWGLIQLHLHDPREGKLCNSHTNHNSLKRAMKWAATYPDAGNPDDWDWAEITRLSSSLNRFIRKLGVNKIGSRSILPEAQTWLDAGGELE